MLDTNKRIVSNDNRIMENINEIKNVIELIDDFSTLSLGRDIVLVGRNYFSLQKILMSVEFTLSNLCICCENGCIADANVLLRKYRDDMFFYLFLLNYKDNKLQAKDDIEIDRNVEGWFNNARQGLYIGEILKKIQENEKVKDLVKRYNLKDAFDRIADRLNNYVHGNGYIYYNESLIRVNMEQVYQDFKHIVRNLKYITTVFFVIVILLSPVLVMADDYISSLEVGITPLPNSQYVVAPFIELFLRKNTIFIDKSCYNFLKENTCMKLA